jgi:trans-aconitate 2-methyltransferase
MNSNSLPASKVKWDAELYTQKHAFVFEYGANLIDILRPTQSERILDLGCGTGELTSQISARCHRVIGVDLSQSMIHKAQQNHQEIEFQVGDARNYRTHELFDAIFSNAAFHWIKEADALAETLFSCLKPGGRVVAEMGGYQNISQIRNALKETLNEFGVRVVTEPWYFPTIGQYADHLEKKGLIVDSALLFERPTRLAGEDGMRKWLDQFATDFLVDVAESCHEEIFDATVSRLRPVAYRDNNWWANYWRLRFVAHKPIA